MKGLFWDEVEGWVIDYFIKILNKGFSKGGVW
jgi:hypothetical protein